MAPILVPTGPVSLYPIQGYRPLRAVSAGLRLPGRRVRTLTVTLELLPWSECRTELAIWTNASAGVLADRNVAAYLNAAHRSLKTLAALVEASLAGSEAPRHALAFPAARSPRRAVAARE